MASRRHPCSEGSIICLKQGPEQRGDTVGLKHVCLLRAGEDKYWGVFAEAYQAALQHYKLGAWYHDAHASNGQPTHIQFTALQAFWPGEVPTPF